MIPLECVRDLQQTDTPEYGHTRPAGTLWAHPGGSAAPGAAARVRAAGPEADEGHGYVLVMERETAGANE